MARLARLLCVSAGVVMAVWLLPASIHVIDWSAGGPVRVALLAPARPFVLALAVSVIALFAFATGVRHRGQPAAVAVFDLTKLLAGPAAAWATWAAFCLTVPFVPRIGLR